MPHFAGWAKVNGLAKTQYKDDGRFKLRPNSFHRVPGQSILPLTDVMKKNVFDVHYHWEIVHGGVAGAWCSSAIDVGSIQGHSPSASINSYKVIPAILTSHNWPGGVPFINEYSIGGAKCCGGGAEELDLTQRCCIVNGDIIQPPECPCDEDYLSECANGHVAKVPKNYQSACVYEEPDQSCPPIACNPCEQGTESGPSDILKTTYWSSEFENYLKDFMGINQPDEGSHSCGRPIRGTTSMSAVTRIQNLAAPSVDDFDYDMPTTNCSFKISSQQTSKPRELDTPTGGLDTPEGQTELWRDMADHGQNRGYSWNFTEYEMRYTNIEDPGDPEYNNSPNPSCGSSSTGLWDDLIYFRNGLSKSWPKCDNTPDTPEACLESSEFFEKDENGDWKEPQPSVIRETPLCTYDPCWIGWSGGGELPQEPYCGDDDILKATRWLRYYDRNLENEKCPPERDKVYESKYPCPHIQSYDGDIIPVPGWVEPQKRVYDYWCLIANYSTCLNVNLLMEDGEQSPFSQKTIFFNDPAFMKAGVLNSGRNLSTWKIPPCAESETNIGSYPSKPSKEYCYI